VDLNKEVEDCEGETGARRRAVAGDERALRGAAIRSLFFRTYSLTARVECVSTRARRSRRTDALRAHCRTD
jgi:hypothetical protein